MKKIATFAFSYLLVQRAVAQEANNYIDVSDGNTTLLVIMISIILLLLVIFIYKYIQFKERLAVDVRQDARMDHILNRLTSDNINTWLSLKPKAKPTCENCKNKEKTATGCKKALTVILLIFSSLGAFAQAVTEKKLMGQPGILITIFLLALPLLLAAILIMNKASHAAKARANRLKIAAAKDLSEDIKNYKQEELEVELANRKEALSYTLDNNELSGTAAVADKKGLINNISDKFDVHYTATKRKAAPRPAIDPQMTKLITWYLGCAAFWLLLGTAIGEYVGIKFVVPDADHVSWLSFGRLRPVHTNIVFWGWASLGILGLGHYVVPMVSNTKLYSTKIGWVALILTNLQVTLGTISLMAGVNNGGGEFREYIWPIMALFAVALIITLYNFIATVARRTTKEIYISNWYIVSSIIFTIIVALTAYLPFWQNGLGETIVQGYYMHSGVGMWFTLFTLGLLYYFIPQQLNKPIYAYSLGILAFWTQILFYTIIGTHHFVFSAIPWWLQTVAIVGSMGMIIPVIAATINFLMTFKGHGNKVANSYTLPFFLTAAVYYFIVSMQGTAEAFRFTNLVWHFTDFTVAHSHLGFYGIITFAIWGGTYAIMPRLTGKEPSQRLVGAHFWLAFIGLLLYSVPLMIGGTMKGMMWMEQKPFIEGVVKMFDYWVWRAIGGSLMFFSHIIYFYNFYKMTGKQTAEVDVKEEAFKNLSQEIL